MRRLPLAVILLLLALASGCGGDDSDEANGGETAASGPVTDVTLGDCLARRGFVLQPTTSGVSAATPRGVAFTVALFPSPAEADAAAAQAGSDAIAVGRAVVTPSGDKALAQSDFATIEDCVR